MFSYSYKYSYHRKLPPHFMNIYFKASKQVLEEASIKDVLARYIIVSLSVYIV